MGTTGRSINVAPLLRNRVFRSHDPVSSHDLVAQELTDHSLKWHRGAIDTSMFKENLRQTSMYLLRYGPEVDIRARPFDDFALVHTSLRVAAEIDCDGQKIQVPEGRSAVLSPRRNLRLNWLSGTEALIVKIPYRLIHELPALTDDEDEGEEFPRGAGFLVPGQLVPFWDSLAQCMLNIVASRQTSELNPEWVDHFERSIGNFLLKHQPAELSLAIRAKSALDIEGAYTVTSREGTRRIEKIYEYMHSRLNAPISLLDLARAGGVSVRTLNLLCHRHFGLPPMEVLRNLRLDSIRSRLLLQPYANITHVALDFGFGNPGRFAAYYRRRFNELPRETQRRPLGTRQMTSHHASPVGGDEMDPPSSGE